MSYTRGSTVRGPALVALGANTIRTKGDVKVTLAFETFNIESAEAPIIDERLSGIPVTIDFDPVGEVTSGLLSAMFAPLSAVVGSSLFGVSDTACTITPLSGTDKITFHCAAITKMPDIIISATKTTLGSMTITAILKNATAWSDAAARLTVATVTAPTVAAIDLATIPTNPAKIKWGATAPWTTLQSREGVTITFDMQTEDDVTDEDGLVDKVLSGVTAKATLSPMGCSAAQAITAFALQGTGVVRGASLAARAQQLEIESAVVGGLKVVMPKATLKNLPLLYGRTSPRFGDFEFVSLPSSGTVATVSIVAAG
jgi:hypothetical protein